MSNHIHFNLLFPSREAYSKFIRAITGLIPRIVMGCERGREAMLQKFWVARPWTKILSWGRQFERTKNYFSLNLLEALGFAKSEGRLILKSTGEFNAPFMKT